MENYGALKVSSAIILDAGETTSITVHVLVSSSLGGNKALGVLFGDRFRRIICYTSLTSPNAGMLCHQ